MKVLFALIMTFSLNALAEEAQKTESKTWDKTKKVINTTADKIDSGTRTVIKKAKSKLKEEQQERDAKKAHHHD